uniref:small monomeric GTPase n=1 Tax=Zonotrichia albicollis TaxID=44394 RepID=A0A8D2N391_ZONAL
MVCANCQPVLGAIILSFLLSQPYVQTRIFKIIVIGDSNVGKTCLTFRFCGGTFPGKTEATIGVDFREKTVEIEGERIKVQVWDTAGQERFRKSMVEHYYRNVHAVVFVYDVTKMSSFTNLKTWIEECNGHAVPPLVPRVLVGNKCDLKDLIQVPSSLALKFADAHNMLLFETSAKDPQESQNVDAIFMCLVCRLKAQEATEQSRTVQVEPTSREAGEHGGAPCQDQDQEGEGGPGVRALCWRERREQDAAG